jgi:hypothetical protein
MLSLIAMPVLAAIACGETPASPPPAPLAEPVAYLTPTEHLVRASMALRGVRPSVEELVAVRDEPRILPAIVEWYLDQPEFGATVRELHDETLLVRVDPILYPAGFRAIGPLEGMDQQAINLSVIEAPLRLIEHVVMNDRPYTEIVTADYTLADRTVATIWGLPYDDGGEEWQVTTYEDGRQPAGILSDSALFMRHSTTQSNQNRGRANAVSRALLCYDFLSREIPIDSSIDLADPDAVAHALRENPACVSCHQTLDPLASFFADYFPIFVPADVDAYPFRFYAPELAPYFQPGERAFFGRPGIDAWDLGTFIAEDPRFSLCAARRFYSYLGQTPIDSVPLELAAELQDVLVESGYDAKALARAVVLSDRFRVSHALAEEGDDAVGLMKVRPEQLARMVEDLTGYRWTAELRFELLEGWGEIGHVDLMSDGFFGFDVLAGGIDGNSVTRPSHTMSATVTLVLRGLAAHAAPFVVDSDLGEPDPSARRLLRRVSAGETGEAAVRAQIAELSIRLYGQFLSPEAPEVTDGWELFRGALEGSGGDIAHAWTTTLYAMLQDIRIAYY